jgi:hypothetical protein
VDEARLADRIAIHDVILRYCRGVDRGDLDLALTCFHPDSIDDHGEFCDSSAEFIASVCGPTFDKYTSVMHYVMNEIVEFTASDVAKSEAYFIAYLRRVEGGETTLDILGGRYVDRFERRGGEWRIAHRVAVYEWSDRKTPGEGFPPGLETFEQGHRFDSDIAYTGKSTRPGR